MVLSKYVTISYPDLLVAFWLTIGRKSLLKPKSSTPVFNTTGLLPISARALTPMERAWKLVKAHPYVSIYSQAHSRKS
jgi:hypothetical protein